MWPRRLGRGKARIDEWCKQVAPSTKLRKRYAHDPERFAEFTCRYLAELEDPERAEGACHTSEAGPGPNFDLLTATKYIEISQAAVIADVIRS